MISSRLRLAMSVFAACALTAAAAGSQPAGPDGAALFAANCAPCHGADGEGRQRNPRLVGSPVASAPGNLVFQILEGSGAMPRFAALLDDGGIAAIVNFVRGTLNDAADMIDASFVALIRG
ncbi:MAG: cytochrome c [Bauldia sp.]|nr:cytochrome c [Bauldia sp.]MCW5718802.1 cytochrome c [Bauldia sp.]